MYYVFIVLDIALCTISISAINVRKTYQDHTSWYFQHPSVRFTKIDVDTSKIKSLSSMPIDTTLATCNERCSIACNMIECCNVAKCDLETKTCSLGFHSNPIKVTGGVEHMVREQKNDIEFEELDGNGICTTADGKYDVARRHYVVMSHEEAREICRFDDGCVAYSFSLQKYIAKSGTSTIMFTTTNCEFSCDNTAWKDDPSLIQKAGPSWVTHKCYVKRNAVEMLTKCGVP